MKKMLTVFPLFCLCALSTAFGDSGMVTRRFGVFVGSNNGGRDRVALRYAVSDARAVSRVFTEMGGIDAADSVVLIEPSLAELNRHIAALHDRVMTAKQTHKRTEILFYYSGHSDEEGLLINRERYRYRDLRERIKTIPSDMRVVILDSCSSGAFTRAKGGVKTQPFLFDDSTATEGYAFLSSSSAAEASQESDAIRGSYFTHSLLAGLRGAADTVGDGRVTLNEVYRYAYAETLARTEVSRYGAQHPSYDMQVSGTGDMVLTDIKETSAGLIIGEAVAGRLSIRDSSDYLVAEITKTAGRPMELGLEPGLYRITLQQGDVFSRAEISLVRDQRARIDPADFRTVAAPPATARGNPAEAEAAAPVEPLSVQLFPGLGRSDADRRATNIVLIGVLGGTGHNLEGFGLSGIGLSNTGFVRGLRFSGLYNMVRRDMTGAEIAGIFNLARENVRGLQYAGIFNSAGGNMEGIQAGGIFNSVRENSHGVQLAGIINMTGGSFGGARLEESVIAFGDSGDWLDGTDIAAMTGAFQGAGIVNVAGGSFRGVQTGGLVNVTHGSFRGAQLAGIVNVTHGSFRGLQMGLVNYRGEGEGKGVGVGLVNVSKDENLVPVGLVNIVKNGMIHPVVWYDDMQFVNLGLKSGTKQVYSTFSLGIRDLKFNSDSLFVTRAGAGIEIPLGKTFIDLDLSAGNIVSRFWSSTSLLAQARVSAGFKLFEHLGVFAGASYDYSYAYTGDSPRPGRDFGISALSWGNGRHTHKIGFFGGIQF
jgi:hypothetical protein